MRLEDRQWAGLFLLAGTTQFAIGMIIAEAVDPSYSVSTNYISDLGVRAGSAVFNTSIILLGITILATSWFLLGIQGPNPCDPGPPRGSRSRRGWRLHGGLRLPPHDRLVHHVPLRGPVRHPRVPDPSPSAFLSVGPARGRFARCPRPVHFE